MPSPAAVTEAKVLADRGSPVNGRRLPPVLSHIRDARVQARCQSEPGSAVEAACHVDR
ncbi:hypothetical protein ABGB14_25890 [Nonomuraea sp. B10E15]|uniref:hypothetical protein n=1 Tax=Nonomuraea sp. B10E15 TaxID=3153560 RepID=UPI00325EDBC4